MKTFIFILMLLESNGDPSAVGDNGKAIGCLQIHPVLVYDVNRIANTKYTLNDRLNPVKSQEMAFIYFRHYLGNSAKPEEMARLWNSGPNWRNKKHLTNNYWKKYKKTYYHFCVTLRASQ
jgi:hypothetical protein